MSELLKLKEELAENERQRRATLEKIAAVERERACTLGEALISLSEKGDPRWKILIGEIASSPAMRKRRSEAFKDEMLAFEKSKSAATEGNATPTESDLAPH